MIQNFISKLSEKEKKILYITIVFVLLAFLDRLFVGPAMEKLKSLESEIESQENLIKRDLRFLSYKNKILRENEDLRKYYTLKSLSEEEIIAAFLKKIEMLASEAKVNLIRVSPSESRQRNGYTEYFATLECDGLLENVAKFAYTIDISGDLLKIVKLDMAPKKAGSDDVTATMAVSKIIIDASALKDAETLVQKFRSDANHTLDVSGQKSSQTMESQSGGSMTTVGELEADKIEVMADDVNENKKSGAD